jgi:regulator of telomere elongation helicase 1
VQEKHKVTIEGIDIWFPKKPYPPQKIYMEKVIEALNKGQYAALESPTGTGKTLCLLVSCFAWIDHKLKQDPSFIPPQILYSSRTHGQLNQVKR